MSSFSKGSVVCFCIFISLATFSCASRNTKNHTSWNEPVTEYNQVDVDAYLGRIDSQYNSLGFKGLHLGMNKSQVNELVAMSPWGYSFMNTDLSIGNNQNIHNDNWPDEPQNKDTNLLKGDKSLLGATWAKIGCEGPKGEGSCYWIRNVLIRFHDDKLTEVAIMSPGYSADKIDTMVKNWGTFALKGLTDKYGNPTSVYNSIESVNILTFKPGYDITLYEWVVGPEKIKLMVGEYESKFGCAIKFQNTFGINKIEENRSKSVSDF